MFQRNSDAMCFFLHLVRFLVCQRVTLAVSASGGISAAASGATCTPKIGTAPGTLGFCRCKPVTVLLYFSVILSRRRVGKQELPRPGMRGKGLPRECHCNRDGRGIFLGFSRTICMYIYKTGMHIHICYTYNLCRIYTIDPLYIICII